MRQQFRPIRSDHEEEHSWISDPPPHDRSEHKCPQLGLLSQLNETGVERFSRVNVILKSLQCVLASTKWKETFISKSNPYSSTLISSDMILTWMRIREFEDDLPVIPNVESHSSRDAKVFILNLDRSNKTKSNERLNRHVEK